MAEFKKHVDDSLYYIRHTMRELPEGKSHGNEDIDMTLTEEKNYSLVHGRCQTAAEANSYRKELEKELFKYNRKGLVKTIEIVIQCPDDCTDKEAFFETSYRYVCDKVLPMGERCVVTAQVHGDEHKFLKDENGNYRFDETGQKIDISKDHLHIIAVPAVPDTKHADYEWKLSAHDLTSKGRLRQFHPGLQKACDDAGIQATVYQKKEGDGKTIGLTVKQLKEITNKTGIVIDKSITVDQLAEILKVNRDITIYDKRLQAQLQDREEKIATLSATVTSQDKTISEMKSKATLKDALIERLQGQLRQKDAELSHSKSSDLEAKRDNSTLQQQLIQKANQIIASKDATIEAVTKDNEELRQQLKEVQAELARSKEKIQDLEAAVEKQVQPERDATWGNQNSWGNTNSWGDTTKTYTEDKTW